jgi:putative transposase
MAAGYQAMQACGMPRQPRFYYAGATLHVVQRGNNRAPVFTSVTDRLFYLHCLEDASRVHDVSIHAYVLMDNHVHLLASPGHVQALPRMMQMLGRRYVGWFNFLHQRTGTLWEGRYKATLIDTDAYLFSCLRYIELNPVRAGIVSSPSDYRWSSHRANGYGARDPVVTAHPSFLASASTDDERRDAFRRTFGQPMPAQTVSAIRDATQFEWALGSEAFRERIASMTGRRGERLRKGRPRTGDEPKNRL